MFTILATARSNSLKNCEGFARLYPLGVDRGLPGFQCCLNTTEPLLWAPVEPVGFAQTLTDHLTVNERILSYVQRDQMETECPDSPEQAANGKKTGMFAFVCYEAALDHANISLELTRLLVGIDVVVVGCLQALLNQPEEDPVRHVPVS